MDDGSIIGKPEVVKQAWNMIVEEGPADGLYANQTKSELVWPSRLPQSHSFPATMKVYPTPNCDILGAPLEPLITVTNGLPERPSKKLGNFFYTSTISKPLIMHTCFFDTVSLLLAWYFSFVQFLLITYLEPVTRSTEL